MIYGILAGNKLHLSEIARSLNENITLKKTIDRLSRNLSAFKEKVFSAAEKGVISATHENLQCLKSLSAHFSKNCVRTLDRGFDANDYYRYFLKNDEKFVIRSKKNRNVIYNGKTQNIMDVAGNYKGNYRMDFKDKHGKKIECKISYIPVRLCEFPNKTLVLVAVYGFGAQPMLLLTNLDLSEKKKLCMIATKFTGNVFAINP